MNAGWLQWERVANWQVFSAVFLFSVCFSCSCKNKQLLLFLSSFQQQNLCLMLFGHKTRLQRNKTIFFFANQIAFQPFDKGKHQSSETKKKKRRSKEQKQSTFSPNLEIALQNTSLPSMTQRADTVIQHVKCEACCFYVFSCFVFSALVDFLAIPHHIVFISPFFSQGRFTDPVNDAQFFLQPMRACYCKEHCFFPSAPFQTLQQISFSFLFIHQTRHC